MASPGCTVPNLRQRPGAAAARSHDLRHTFATWLEDGGIPARVIDELMGHHAGRHREHDGSAVGAHYRHMTPQMQARVLTVIEQRLASMSQACPKGDQPEQSGG